MTSSSVCGSLWKFAMPPTIAARWITCVQPAIAVARLVEVAQVAACGPRSPRASRPGASRWSDTRTSQSGSRSSRRTTAAPIVPAPPVTSTRLTRRLDAARSRRVPNTGPEPRARSTGRPAACRPGSATRAAPSKARVVGGHHHRVGALERRRRAARTRRRHVRVVDAPRRPARARAGGSACSESESRTSSVSRLNASPSTATLRSRSEPPSRRLRPSTRNSGTRLVHARDGEQHARARSSAPRRR